MKAPVESHELLWPEGGRMEGYGSAYQLIQSVRESTNLVVVVTDYEYINGFPSFLVRRDLDESSSYPEIKKAKVC